MIVTVNIHSDIHSTPSLNVSYIQLPSVQANDQFSPYRQTYSPDSQKLIQLQLTAHCLTSHFHGTIWSLNV